MDKTKEEIMAEISRKEDTTVTMDADWFKVGDEYDEVAFLDCTRCAARTQGPILLIINSSGLPKYLGKDIISQGTNSKSRRVYVRLE